MKEQLLSFITPSGRIGRRGFWWRQLALAPLAFAGCFASSLGLLMDTKACVYSQLQGDSLLCDLVGIGEGVLGSTLPNLMAYAWGSVEAEMQVAQLYQLPDVDPAAYALPLMLLGALLTLPAAWACFSLILRRLRDTRVGLWAMPLCLPVLCLLLADKLLGAPKVVGYCVFYTTIVLSHVFFCLPGRPYEGKAPKVEE